MHKHRSMILLFLSVVHIATCIVYTVTPDDYYPNTTCHHCYNLQHYLLNVTKYFTSNTQLLFLPGLHHLHTDLIIQNVHNISLIGSTANGTTLDTVIQCNSSVAILMSNITNLTLSDITVKNCNCDRHSNTAILIMECTNVQLRKITVDSNNSNGIIGINALGKSCFSYIKSHILSIHYNDTPSAQNNSEHSILINYFNIINHSSAKSEVLNFTLLQHSYKVKLELVELSIHWLNNKDNGVYVTFGYKQLLNELIIQNSQFIHNTNIQSLIYIDIKELHYDTISNNTVKIESCQFSYNQAHNGSIMNFYGSLANVFIYNCKFHCNKNLTMIKRVPKYLITPLLLTPVKEISTHYSIMNTNFSSIHARVSIDLYRAKLHLIGPMMFYNNVCSKSIIRLHDSSISFTNYSEFMGNKGNAIITYIGRANYYLILMENSILNISGNNYTSFAYTINVLSKIPKCFFQYFSNRQLDMYHGNYSIIFEKNNEENIKSAYNNLPIVHCSWLPQSAYSKALPPIVNNQYIQFINNFGESVMLPQYTRHKTLCYCNADSHYDCYKEILDPTYPGQTITIWLYNSRNTYGSEDYRTKDVVVDTSLATACEITDSSEIKQSIISNNCTELKYSIAFPSDDWCELFLRTTFRHGDSHTDIYYITQLPCPIGFIKYHGECQCETSIRKYNIECDINDETILRPANSWISATTHNNSYTYHISLHCPFHYCLPNSSHLNILTPNSQCQFNRSGVLCGHCQQGLSSIFTSSHCHHCSNINLFFIVPIIIAGFALVILLFCINLTIRVGLLNPFILYANIISINLKMYFPNEDKFSPTRIFISLANLDLGIPICFYNGMDDYAKMWLQLAFPFYLIFIAICLIMASRYFSTVQRLTARRALPVLATLFLLSYTKILLTVSSVLFSYSTIINLPSEHKTLVWSIDGNVPLLGVRFISLFTACLVLFLILIPFSLVLLLIRWLSKFRFINKFKPLLDIYQGPYKDKFYYWTGLQLVLRVIFVGICSSLERNLSLTIGNILLSAFGFFQGYCSPYKVALKNINELLLLFNLLGLHILLNYGKDDVSITAVNVMITIVAIHFLFIVTYHIITYAHGGVIRNKIQSIIITIIKWITFLKSAQTQPAEPQEFPLVNIPNVTDQYCEYEEPLLALN